MVLKVRLTPLNVWTTSQLGPRAIRLRHAGLVALLLAGPPGYVEAVSFRVYDVTGLKA